MENEAILQVKNLKKYFDVGRGKVLKAVDDISFEVYKGETFGIVGESGCGKSTAGRTIMTLYNKTSGQVLYEGFDVHELNEKERFNYFRKMQMIFQDPYASLNPRSTVKEIISEPMEIHGLYPNKKEMTERVYELLEEVGLNRDHANRYPHEFSGGQRQRIGIARALSVNPKLIIADEAVSALDVSIQAQVLNLMKRLQKEFQLTYLFISHDLGVVRHISDRIIVMYLGKIVEIGDKKSLFDHPQHPYTQALLSAIPLPDPEKKKERIILKGDVPSPIDPPTGCRFHTRCPFATEKCRQEEPKLRVTENMSDTHQVACHYVEEIISGKM